MNPKKNHALENHVRQGIVVKVTTKRNIYTTYLSLIYLICAAAEAHSYFYTSARKQGGRRRFSYVENEICRKPNLVYSILCIVFFTQLILPATLSNGVRRKIEVVSIENKQQTSWLTGPPHKRMQKRYNLPL